MTTTSAPARPTATRPELEASLEAYFRRAVRTAGGLIYKVAPTVRGLPDRLVVLPGGVMALVELKAVGGRLSPIQEHLHAELAAIGSPVVVLTGREQINSWIGKRFDGLEKVERRGGPRVKGVSTKDAK